MTASEKDELLGQFNSCYRFVTCYTPPSIEAREEAKGAEEGEGRNGVVNFIMRFLTT